MEYATTQLNVLNSIIEVSASLKQIDVGIGSYEFWGSKGYDSQMTYEIVDKTFDWYFVEKGNSRLKIRNWIDDNWDYVTDCLIDKLH